MKQAESSVATVPSKSIPVYFKNNPDEALFAVAPGLTAEALLDAAGNWLFDLEIIADRLAFDSDRDERGQSISTRVAELGRGLAFVHALVDAAAEARKDPERAIGERSEGQRDS